MGSYFRSQFELLQQIICKVHDGYLQIINIITFDRKLTKA